MGARGVVGNDGEGALVGDCLAEMVGVISGVGHHDLRGRPSIRALAGGASPRWPAERMNRTGHPRPPTARWILVLRPPRVLRQAQDEASDGLILSPLFAPLACW